MTDSSRKINRGVPIVAIVMIAFSAFVCLLVVALPLSCVALMFLNVKDSWGHYVGGGNYSCSAGSMSPCGEYLVFGSPKSGRGDVWRLRLEDSAMHQITSSRAFESHPRYSPDGESIFYLRERGGYRHIWKTDRDGQSHERLTFGWMSDILVDVSPDGDSLIVLRGYWAGGKGMGVTPAMIYSVSNKTFTEEDIGSSGRFLDNHAVLFNTRDHVITRFGKYDLETRQRHILGDGLIACLSPNRKNILISRDPNRSFFERELFVFDLDEQSEKRIGTGRHPAFLGDSKVFFVQSSPRRAYIYSLEGGTTSAVELPGAIVASPVVAPGNRGILLRLTSPNDADRAGNIYLFDGESIEKLTQ